MRHPGKGSPVPILVIGILNPGTALAGNLKSQPFSQTHAPEAVGKFIRVILIRLLDHPGNRYVGRFLESTLHGDGLRNGMGITNGQSMENRIPLAHINRCVQIKFRSEERRVGNKCVSTYRSRWLAYL